MNPHAGRSTALFLPCRRGSERVPDKNTRPFAGHHGGLLGLKLDQLAGVEVERIVLDSNDPVVLEYATKRLRIWDGHAALIVRERPDELGQSSTTTDALIAYALATIDAEVLAWTHVTSPFCGAATYHRALAAWAASDHDSLMAVLPLRSFVWSHTAPLNYQREALRWPRTQDLTPLYDVCSALFVVPTEVGRRCRDRIGERPLLFELSKIEATDIDWDDDFRLAEALWPRYGSPA